jgi:predicted metal-binding protein
METLKNQIKLIGIIQCDFAKEHCSGFACTNAFHHKIDAFSIYPNSSEIMVVPFNCGGCPGRRIGRIVNDLIQRSKKLSSINKEEIAIHLASCIVTDNGHYPPCPHIDDIEKILKRRGVDMIKGSHKSKLTEKRREKGIYELFQWPSVNSTISTDSTTD